MQPTPLARYSFGALEFGFWPWLPEVDDIFLWVNLHALLCTCYLFTYTTIPTSALSWAHLPMRLRYIHHPSNLRLCSTYVCSYAVVRFPCDLTTQWNITFMNAKFTAMDTNVHEPWRIEVTANNCGPDYHKKTWMTVISIGLHRYMVFIASSPFNSTIIFISGQ